MGSPVFRGLELRTNLLVMRGLSQYEDQGDVVIQRTPSEPDFWFGNCLIQRAPELSPDDVIARFDEAFPRSAHKCVLFDFPDPPLGSYAKRGWEVSSDDVLTLREVPNPVALAPGYDIRRIESDEEWDALLDLSAAIGVEEGFDPVPHRAYLSRRLRNRQRQVEEGFALWLGVYAAGTLAASMGVMIGDGLIRFQDVQTDAAHRRRGLCAALLRHTLTLAQQRDPRAKPVIVAEADGDAGRIYRRAGFTLEEQSHSALLPGYASGRSAAVT